MGPKFRAKDKVEFKKSGELCVGEVLDSWMRGNQHRYIIKDWACQRARYENQLSPIEEFKVGDKVQYQFEGSVQEGEVTRINIIWCETIYLVYNNLRLCHKTASQLTLVEDKPKRSLYQDSEQSSHVKTPEVKTHKSKTPKPFSRAEAHDDSKDKDNENSRR